MTDRHDERPETDEPRDTDAPRDTEDPREPGAPRDTDEPRETDEPRDARELADRVSELGETPEDALEEVANRNASLEERLPDDDLTGGHPQAESEVTRGEGAPGQG